MGGKERKMQIQTPLTQVKCLSLNNELLETVQRETELNRVGLSTDLKLSEVCGIDLITF